jgi:hypothetical protein
MVNFAYLLVGINTFTALHCFYTNDFQLGFLMGCISLMLFAFARFLELENKK